MCVYIILLLITEVSKNRRTNNVWGRLLVRSLEDLLQRILQILRRPLSILLNYGKKHDQTECHPVCLAWNLIFKKIPKKSWIQLNFLDLMCPTSFDRNEIPFLYRYFWLNSDSTDICNFNDKAADFVSLSTIIVFNKWHRGRSDWHQAN